MVYIEEFSHSGRDFIYISLPRFSTRDELRHALKTIGRAMEKYAENSLYAILNIENLIFDTKTITLTAKYMKYSKPYVKYEAVIGIDGVKKTLFVSMLRMSERDNMCFAFTKEQAIELLLQQQ